MATIRKRAWTTARGEEREAWLADFRDAGGKRRYRQFSTKKAADAWLVQARGQVAAGTFTPDSELVTVAQAAELWLARCEQDRLEPATLNGYRSHLHYIEPLLGRLRLSRLTVPMVEAFKDDLLASGRCLRILAKKVLASVKAILKDAQRRGLVNQNVAQPVSVKLASRHKTRLEIPTRDENRDLLAQAQGRERVLLMLAIFCGLRISEIRGLRWQDVDFDQRIVRIRQRASNAGIIGPLKSAAARRDVPMAPLVLNALREWRLRSWSSLVFAGKYADRPACYVAMCRRLGPLHRFQACVRQLVDR